MAAQIYLIVGFVWFVASWWAGPDNESIRFNLFGLGVAALIAVAVVVWWRGTSWPLRVLNVLVACILAFALFLVWFWGTGYFFGFPGIAGTTALAVGFVGAVFTTLAAGVSPRRG